MMSVQLTPPPPRGSPVLEAVTSNLNEPGVQTFVQSWSGWFRNLYNLLLPGISQTVVLAKLTSGGANGQLVFKNGILTSYTAPT